MHVKTLKKYLHELSLFGLRVKCNLS